MTISDLNLKLDELLSLPAEAAWVQFKHNNNPQEIGEYSVDFRIHEFDRNGANHNVFHSRRNVNPGELFGRGVHPSGEL